MSDHSPSTPWTLDELAAKANQALAGSEAIDVRDSRLSGQLTPRNIRRLQSEGVINPPQKLGREAYYGQEHLDQLLQARDWMSKGVSASAIPALRESGATSLASASLASAPAPLESSRTAQALAFLGACRAPEAPPKAARPAVAGKTVFECEPIPGLRLSASPPAGAPPLSAHDLERLLEAAQAAWGAASGRLD